ncbi:MAG: response regulator, partial [Planctomycetota bacterium]|nr:response regulator [Planctomycetota bacterium]
MVGSQQVEILLVENDDQESRWLRDAFEKTGLIHVVQVVPDGPAALQALRGTNRISPSLIMLDSPSVNGGEELGLTASLELLGELKGDSLLRPIPVVVVTGNNPQADVLNAYSHGACSFVCKPESEADRQTLIGRFSEYWGQVAELPWATPNPGALPVRTMEELVDEYKGNGSRTIEVLIVDDSEDDVVLLREAFSDCPLVDFIGTVEDGEQALSFLRQEGVFQNSKRPGLVLMDINMPRKNGFEVLAEMRSDPQLSSVPVVMLTT